ncbi:helix-turn-helix domain-containing protein [Halioglobus maricola]|uniref:helix-turn-helix domain-containing protein n=1 Tax=Halioglobus maricola TaxID=2601894 RepID=UPI0014792DB2|nr:helix-turn-helix transcriptional regulator [Halioglobus maricola]
MSELENVSAYLADNIIALRKRSELSQGKLAEKAGIPRSTLTHMESGAGNPSLTNLCKLAAALGVNIEELLSRPRNECSLLKADQVPILKRSGGKVQVHKLMPDKVRGIEIDRMQFVPGSSMAGKPHLQGTKEYLVTLLGSVGVAVGGQSWEVEAGDVLAFPGDQKHGYRNLGKGNSEALSIVLPLPYPVP